MLLRRLELIWCLLKETTLEFIDNNSFQKGAALSYYTIFALPPVIIIIINLTGYIFSEQAVSGEIYYQLKELIGTESAYEVQKIVENINAFTDINFATLIGLATLFIAATGAFISLQDSLNEIWCVKSIPKRGILKLVLDRFLSFGMILAIAVLVIVFLLANTALVFVGNFLTARFSGSIVYILHLSNFFIALVILTFLFSCIYKFLPDAKIKWRDVWVGGLVTAVLFSIARSVIGFYLGTVDVGSMYGAAGSVIVILTWVFLVSQFVFFGAVFTFVYSRKYGHNIYPAEYAVRIVKKEIEAGKSAVNAEPGKHAKEVYTSQSSESKEEITPAMLSAGENI